VAELARGARISQPAASRHLKVLRAAHLVRVRQEGTRRYCRASPEGLVELRRYIESLWDDVFSAYSASPPSPA